jgi:hypothetical protein
VKLATTDFFVQLPVADAGERASLRSAFAEETFEHPTLRLLNRVRHQLASMAQRDIGGPAL